MLALLLSSRTSEMTMRVTACPCLRCSIYLFKLTYKWQVKRDHSVTADHGESTSWGDDDPSVFAMTNVGDMHGEFQICNGYGTGKAAAVLRVRSHSGLWTKF
jgi:hypothetical protein